MCLNRLHWRGYLRAYQQRDKICRTVLIAYIGGVICGFTPNLEVFMSTVLIAYIGGVICGALSRLPVDDDSLNRLHWRGYLRAARMRNLSISMVLIAYIGGVICGGRDDPMLELGPSLNRLHWRGYLRGPQMGTPTKPNCLNRLHWRGYLRDRK